MSASRKAGYYWVKYVSQNHWSIEYWNGGMWFTRNSHLVEDSMFSTIDETPIVREQKEPEQQSNCNLPDVIHSGNWKCLLCGRETFTHKTPHKCKGGYRKRNIIWERIS